MGFEVQGEELVFTGEQMFLRYCVDQLLNE
jgi:hypothetical protein